VTDSFEEPAGFSPEVFDQGFVDAAEDDGHVAEVFRSVMGDEYPGDVEPDGTPVVGPAVMGVSAGVGARICQRTRRG
jgi:hypothetical protein